MVLSSFDENTASTTSKLKRLKRTQEVHFILCKVAGRLTWSRHERHLYVCVVHMSRPFSAVCKTLFTQGQIRDKKAVLFVPARCLLCFQYRGIIVLRPCLATLYKETSKSNLSSCKHSETNPCHSLTGDKASIHCWVGNLDLPVPFLPVRYPSLPALSVMCNPRSKKLRSQLAWKQTSCVLSARQSWMSKKKCLMQTQCVGKVHPYWLS